MTTVFDFTLLEAPGLIATALQILNRALKVVIPNVGKYLRNVGISMSAKDPNSW